MYTVEPGHVLRKRFEGGRIGANPKETQAFEITDIERFVLAAWFQARVNHVDDLAIQVLQIGLDWEHLLALMSANPAERAPEHVAKLEELTVQSEILAAEIDVRTGAVDRNGNPLPPVRGDRGGDQ